jgi:streptogramin lyase
MKRSQWRLPLAALLTAIVLSVGWLGLSTAPARAAAGTVTIFQVSSTPFFITSGPDGNLWFTQGETAQIGRITPSGTITDFSTPTASSGPDGITAGPDGNMWFTEQNAGQIGRLTISSISVSSKGKSRATITEFPLKKASSQPLGITPGPDGNLWFTEQNTRQIGRITTSGTITEFPLPTGASVPQFITAGPDGNLWFTDGAAIGRITTNGAITEFPVPHSATGITTGPDGNLWFTMFYNNLIGRLTPAGVLTSFAIPSCGPNYPICGAYSITTGPNGNLWFTLHDNARVEQITTSGSLISGFGTGSGPLGITVGPDGNLWFTDEGSFSVGRFVAS